MSQVVTGAETSALPDQAQDGYHRVRMGHRWKERVRTYLAAIPVAGCCSRSRGTSIGLDREESREKTSASGESRRNHFCS